MMPFRGGREWLVDAYGCAPEALRSAPVFEALFATIIDDLGLLRAAPSVTREFDGPGGLTMLLPLMESHLTVHTYPEFALATINLYCCAERACWRWEGALAQRLGATRVDVRSISRGACPP